MRTSLSGSSQASIHEDHAQCEAEQGGVLSGDGGDSTVCAPSLAVQVLGDELEVEGLPCCTIQPCRLLLLAGHDLKEHCHGCGLRLHTHTALFTTLCRQASHVQYRLVPHGSSDWRRPGCKVFQSQTFSAHSVTQSLTQSFSHSFTLTHPPSHSFTHSLMRSFIHHARIHSLNPLTCPLVKVCVQFASKPKRRLMGQADITTGVHNLPDHSINVPY